MSGHIEGSVTKNSKYVHPSTKGLHCRSKTKKECKLFVLPVRPGVVVVGGGGLLRHVFFTEALAGTWYLAGFSLALAAEHDF